MSAILVTLQSRLVHKLYTALLFSLWDINHTSVRHGSMIRINFRAKLSVHSPPPRTPCFRRICDPFGWMGGGVGSILNRSLKFPPYRRPPFVSFVCHGTFRSNDTPPPLPLKRDFRKDTQTIVYSGFENSTKRTTKKPKKKKHETKKKFLKNRSVT